jgi:4-amino-4-deoxy-L-arabinose transferase-like glycosyltransferase
LPWLVVRWRRAFLERDLRVALPVAWIVLVVLFFSFSSGKRGVYILPTLPALALATAPYARGLLEKKALSWAGWLLAAAWTLAAALGAAYLTYVAPSALDERLYGLEGAASGLVWPVALLGLAVLLLFRPRRGLVALGALIVAYWGLYGWYLWPRLDPARSGRPIMDAAYAALPPDAKLGLAFGKESLILHARGELTNFGHRRRDGTQEGFDAARWLADGAERFLIVPRESLGDCFVPEAGTALGRAHGQLWLLLPQSAAREQCVRAGRDVAIAYHAPARR